MEKRTRFTRGEIANQGKKKKERNKNEIKTPKKKKRQIEKRLS